MANYGTAVAFVEVLYISSCSYHITSSPYFFIASTDMSNSVHHNPTFLLGFYSCHGTCLDTQQGNVVLYLILSFMQYDAELYGKLINIILGSASLI
jgi:hypothetical protein